MLLLKELLTLTQPGWFVHPPCTKVPAPVWHAVHPVLFVHVRHSGRHETQTWEIDDEI